MRKPGVRAASVTLLCACAPALLGALPAFADTGAVTLEVPGPSGSQRGFDIDTAQMVLTSAASVDVRAGTNTTSGYRQLVALNGAGVAKLSDTDFDAVSCATLRSQTYLGSIFTGADGLSDPVPGTLFAARSSQDRYVKLRLVSIKTLAPKGLVMDFVTSPCPLDSTPPDVTASLNGLVGDGSWFVGPVTVEWTVSDPESPISSSSGCETVTLTDDAAAIGLTCSATSAGGTTSEAIVVSIDRTPPTVAYSGNRGVYDVDERVQIECVAGDATSGVAADSCESVDAPSYELGPGDHTLAADATDAAGNRGSGRTSFRCVATAAGLIRLVARLVTDATLAQDLIRRVEQIAAAPTLKAKGGKVGALRNHLAAVTGKQVDAATAQLIGSLAALV